MKKLFNIVTTMVVSFVFLTTSCPFGVEFIVRYPRTENLRLESYITINVDDTDTMFVLKQKLASQLFGESSERLMLPLQDFFRFPPALRDENTTWAQVEELVMAGGGRIKAELIILIPALFQKRRDFS